MVMLKEVIAAKVIAVSVLMNMNAPLAESVSIVGHLIAIEIIIFLTWLYVKQPAIPVKMKLLKKSLIAVNVVTFVCSVKSQDQKRMTVQLIAMLVGVVNENWF